MAEAAEPEAIAVSKYSMGSMSSSAISRAFAVPVPVASQKMKELMHSTAALYAKRPVLTGDCLEKHLPYCLSLKG